MKKNIVAEKVGMPTVSALAGITNHYADSFESSIVVGDDQTLDIVTVGRAFFSSSPKWIEPLFKFRNRLVSIFGLKTDGGAINKEEVIRNFKGNVGDRLGLFKVFNRTENELIFGEDDKHLDFRVSLLLADANEEQQKLTISTTVHFHNWFGRLYFLPVQPFHSLIVPAMLKGIVRHLEQDVLENSQKK